MAGEPGEPGGVAAPPEEVDGEGGAKAVRFSRDVEAELEPGPMVERQEDGPKSASLSPAPPGPATQRALRFEVGDPGRAAAEVIQRLPGDPGLPVDTIVDGGRTGELEVRAASVCGLSHRAGGKPRQDDFAMCTGGGWAIVAVADGVSAGPLSHQAATLACRTGAGELLDAVLSLPWAEVDWRAILESCSRRILTHGRRMLAADGQPAPAAAVAKEMATTLLLAAISTDPDADGRYHGGVVALGDTTAFMVDRHKWFPMTALKNAGTAIASSATAALPYLPPTDLAVVDIRLSPGSALFLMTDGVGDPLGSGNGEVGEFLAGVWAEPPDPLLFAAQVSFARRSFDDDRTVVGLWAPP